MFSWIETIWPFVVIGFGYLGFQKLGARKNWGPIFKAACQFFSVCLFVSILLFEYLFGQTVADMTRTTLGGAFCRMIPVTRCPEVQQAKNEQLKLETQLREQRAAELQAMLVAEGHAKREREQKDNRAREAAQKALEAILAEEQARRDREREEGDNRTKEAAQTARDILAQEQTRRDRESVDTVVPIGEPPAETKLASADAAAVSPPPPSNRRFSVHVSSQKSEDDARASYRAIASRYSGVLGGQPYVVRRADLGRKGVYYRAMVGPFASRDEAVQLCSSLKSAGGDCIVQAN
jgi:hypothetical protein